jgi:hypothetical protein
MIEGILIGLKTALTFQNIFMVMIGCFFGTIIGMLPGLGPMTAIALMIPITYGFDPATGLILMAGVYYGAVFGGSTSSILLNAPGVPGSLIHVSRGYLGEWGGSSVRKLVVRTRRFSSVGFSRQMMTSTREIAPAELLLNATTGWLDVRSILPLKNLLIQVHHLKQHH